MDTADVLEILRRLDRAEIGWWIDGGWGVDALIGRRTRAHDDLDLVVEKRQINRLGPLFPEFARAEHDWWPARFVLRDATDRQLDFHPVAFDDNGDGWQELPDGTRGRYPAGGLAGRGVVGGRDVRCITPELQLRHHDYAVGRPDDVDWYDVRMLCDHYELAVPPSYAERPGFLEPKRKRAVPPA
jgi:lincosamide nucleotidyltransferase A/C/D/E